MKAQIFNTRMRLLPTLIMIFTLNGISPPLEGAGGGLYAQDPQLFEQTWYLEKVVLDGEEFLLPSTPEANNAFLDIFIDYMATQVCGGGMAGEIVEFDIENDFFIVDEFYLSPLDCIDEETQVFENLYYDFFIQAPDYTFYYTIITDDDNKSLVLTNENGDEAHYGNHPLSNQEFDTKKLSVYPNPVSEVLYIQNSDINSTNLNIKVYDINGSMVLSQAMETSLNVKELKSGLYFLSIESNPNPDSYRDYREGYRQVLRFVKK